MRIQVDARLLTSGGIGRYIREITGRWLSRSDVGAVRFFGRPAELDPFLAERDRRGIAEVVPWSDGPYSPAAQLRWPRLTRGLAWQADLTFLPHYDVPVLGPPTPSLVTVHDLIHFQVPEGFPTWKRALGMALMRRALEKATSVVTVSETSHEAICALMPSVADKVHIVRNGVGDEFRGPSGKELEAARSSWGHLQPFMLCVGPDKLHKNLRHAVRTLGRLPDEEGWRLVLVGPSEAERDRLVAGAGRPDLAPRVVVTGQVADGDLRSLYALAAAVLAPSLLEGFGLPVLEARACGARVLVGDVPWARELESTGATIVPGWSPATWAREVRGSGPEASRFERAAWRWEVAAERTFEVLRATLG